jgi:hypothetical protein
MSRRFINWAIALAVLCVMAAIQWLDASDFEVDAANERREWMYAIQHCHRAFGPQTAPEYDDQDRLICVGKRGQRLAAIDTKTLKVAGK